MKKIKLYSFDSIGDYDTEEIGLGDSGYYDIAFHNKYYGEEYEKDRKPFKQLWGRKNKILLEEPILFFTDDIRDEHQLDESIPDEYKENMETPSLWRMPLIFTERGSWIVRDDLFNAICDTITVGEYEIYDTEIYNSHLDKTFTNYKIIHILNIAPNMDESEYEMDSEGWKVPRPKFSKMKFNEKDFKEVIASEYLIGGPLVTEEFKNKLDNFSKELHFSYMDFDNSELGFDVFS